MVTAVVVMKVAPASSHARLLNVAMTSAQCSQQHRIASMMVKQKDIGMKGVDLQTATKLEAIANKWAWSLAEACNEALRVGAKADGETFIAAIREIQKQTLGSR